MRKKCPDFGKKCPVCVHLWVKFSFKMQFYDHLGEKAQKCFPVGFFFCMSYVKPLSMCTSSKKSPLPRKFPSSVPVQSVRKTLFILTVHSYSFLPFLYNLSHRLTELNVSLFYLIKVIFFKNI